MAGCRYRSSGVDADVLIFHPLGNRIIREGEGKGPALGDHASDAAKFRVLLRDVLLNEVASKAGLGKLILDGVSEFYWPYKSELDCTTQDSYFQWVADAADPALKERLAALKAERHQVKTAKARAFAELQRETRLTEENITAFAT